MPLEAFERTWENECIPPPQKKKHVHVLRGNFTVKEKYIDSGLERPFATDIQSYKETGASCYF